MEHAEGELLHSTDLLLDKEVSKKQGLPVEPGLGFPSLTGTQSQIACTAILEGTICHWLSMTSTQNSS